MLDLETINEFLSIFDTQFSYAKWISEDKGLNSIKVDFEENERSIFTIAFNKMTEVNFPIACYIGSGIIHILKHLYFEMSIEDNNGVIVASPDFIKACEGIIEKHAKLIQSKKLEIKFKVNSK